jgi:hypothetical protein
MKICPECKYERTIQDNLLFPDYECPSCGIIFEKDKAKQELAELEKQREKERKAKREKLKKEEERKRKAEEKRLRLEEQQRKEKEEELKRQEEEERKRLEEEERQKKAEAERLQKLEEEKIRKEEAKKKKEQEEKLRLEEQQRKEKEEQKRQDEEARRRKKELEKKRLKEEAEQLRIKRQEEIKLLAQENRDKIITRTETDNGYHLFDMCPFAIAQTGKGLSIAVFGENKNKWQHGRCMQKYCRLWTMKFADNGDILAQGCSLQFLGLSKEEVENNFKYKNTEILEDTYTAQDEIKPPKEEK